MEKSTSPLSRCKASPPVEKSRRKLHQPRQKSNTMRFNSTNSHTNKDLESIRKQLNSSLTEFTQNPLQQMEQHLSLFDTRSKTKKQAKPENKKSPYYNTRFVTIRERSPKIHSRGRYNAKVDLHSIQAFFFDFQRKSKILLQQLEKNVLG